MRTIIVKIYMVVTTFFLGFLLTGTVIASENATAISNALGTPNYEKVESTDENVDTEYFKSRYTNLADLINDGKNLVEEIEAEGVVMLKNADNTLPLKANAKVSMFGIASYSPAYGGKGSAQSGTTEGAVSLKDGLINAGFEVNEELYSFYKDNASKYTPVGRGTSLKLNDAPWRDIEAESSVYDSISRYSDVAIFIFNRLGGEGSDYASTGVQDGTDGDTLKLSPNELSVLKGLKALKDAGIIKKIVVLANTANQIESTYLKDPNLGVDAALWIGTVGITGFNAVGKILNGTVNPSGHLSDMHWYNHKDNPANTNYGAFTYKNVDNFDLPYSGSKVDTKYSAYSVYQEGIYVGYRYAETRYADVVTKRANAGSFVYGDSVSHPFGYGASYTEFEYSNYRVSKNKNVYEITVDVENVGKTYSGKDVVQIYLQKPYTDFDIERGIEKSAVELVGFAKTKNLAPGEKETLKIYVDESEFRVYDANVDKTYIITEGDYYLTAATDSHNAINNILTYQDYKNLDGEGNKRLVEKIHLNYDNKTYSKSKATGNTITNLFDEADINKYSGKGKNEVTYVSRNNWENTIPTSYAVLSMTTALQNDLLAQDGLKIEQDNVAYPLYGQQNGLMLIDLKQDSEGNPIPYDSELWDQFLDQLTWEQTCKLLYVGLRKTEAVAELGKPETLDHNGPAGLTERYGKSKNGLAYKLEKDQKLLNSSAPYYPCAGIIAATFNVELVKKFGDMLGEDALWAGYNGFYGIAINTHRSPYQGRTYEYFSEDPFLAGIMAVYEVNALQAKGCNAYIKHFALNEQENNRNGVSIWLNEQTLREIYLRPYEFAVIEANAYNAMASFTRIGAKYCPASKELLTDFLRGELGMKGLVVTDMYNIGYKSAHMPVFLMAGTDIPDGEVTADKVYDKYKTGYGSVAQQMREAAKRVLYSTVHSNAMNGYSSSTKIIPITPSWMVALIVADSSVGALWLAGAGYVTVRTIKNNKKKKEN